MNGILWFFSGLTIDKKFGLSEAIWKWIRLNLTSRQ